MRYMLDTNIVSDLLRHPAGEAARHIARVGEENICISIIAAAELRYGAAKGKSPALPGRVQVLLARVPVLPFEPPADTEYAGIRTALETAGQPIGPNDLLIAAHARSIGAIIVTANDREFRRVPGLSVENWLA